MDNDELQNGLSPVEREIDVLLKKAIEFLQTYRAIDAMPFLSRALAMVESDVVQWRVSAAVYGYAAEAYIQLRQNDHAICFYKRAFDVSENEDCKANFAGLVAGYYQREGKNTEAQQYAKSALTLAKNPELLIYPNQIMGNIALSEGDYPKAIEFLNKAASYSEACHCIVQLGLIIMDISETFLKMGRNEIALSEIYRAERYVKESNNLDLYFRCAVRRARILFLMGMDDEAKALIMSLDEQKN